MRGYLIAAGIYYLIITASHPFYERAALAVLMGLSAVAAVVCLGFHRLLRNPASAQLTLEMAALATNALILANVVAYLSIHYEAPKLVYFVIMALGFATVGPSVRILAPSVILALAALVFFAGQAGPGAAGSMPSSAGGRLRGYRAFEHDPRRGDARTARPPGRRGPEPPDRA
uniref:Uncharacterized protein n=1 Tax=Phenylobacterium glaciei TaxID=2803784 RepID=A0A974S831_9CAUL|nr:hypothetical protein JKL49_18635 [Phenylobacterium glaciei]